MRCKVALSHASSKPPAADLSQDKDTMRASSSANTADPREAEATASLSSNTNNPVSQPLPPLPISSNYVLDFTHPINQAHIDELADAMNPYPRQHPDKEECKHLAGLIVIQNTGISI